MGRTNHSHECIVRWVKQRYQEKNILMKIIKEGVLWADLS